jgi:transketolase
MTVICPCDYNQTKAATIALSEHIGPAYLRFGRPSVPNFTKPDEKFEIGKAQKLIPGNDVSIFATGHMVWQALEAAKILKSKGISAEIINIHTIKPLDENAVISSISKTNAIVTAEEHMLNGGLFDSIAQVAALNNPTPMEAVAVFDTFGESGTPNQLLEKYGLTAEKIVIATEKVVRRKNHRQFL